MSSPTPIITPPPPPPPPTRPIQSKSFDFTNWSRKLSTLLAALVGAFTAVSGTIMGHYLSLTPEQQAGWPFWLPMLLVIGPGALAALGPVAVAFRQTFFDDTDSAGV